MRAMNKFRDIEGKIQDNNGSYLKENSHMFDKLIFQLKEIKIIIHKYDSNDVLIDEIEGLIDHLTD